MKILFIGKKGDARAESAAACTLKLFPETEIVWSARNMPYPEELKSWQGDYVFSYLSQWIIPVSTLDGASKAAINWHPGPPEYPGIGCTNFAIYNEEKEFGITCHHMNPRVDTGPIIQVRKFPIQSKDSVWKVTQQCYEEIAKSYQDVIALLAEGEELPASEKKWTRNPYRRDELDALCELTLDMSEKEMKLRIKATKYDRHWAYLNINGVKFMPVDG